MLVSLLKYRKPSFVYLYTIFGVFLTILVALSLIFSQRLSSLIRYSDDADKVYSIFLQFEKLENSVKDVETTGRGFMLTRDSSFLDRMEGFNAGIQPVLDSLGKLLQDDVVLSDRLTRISYIVRESIKIQKLNIQKVALNDTFGLAASLYKGEYYMSQFREEIRILEKDGVKKGSMLDREKKFYENVTPGLFTQTLVFSGIVSLLSFFYIIREIKIRLKYQKELERRLLELNRSYAELEQFTFVASHDLQEPLRKIRTFSDQLLSKYNPQLEPKAKDIIERMDIAVGRVQELIRDITNFSALINKEEVAGTVDLNEIVAGTLSEFNNRIQEMNMSVFVDALPVITGFSNQLTLLFTALIDNAIKFSKTQGTPLLKIKYGFLQKGYMEGATKLTQDYHKISIEDNGIGFDDEFAEKIFMIFQRLHPQQSKYHGKGIGLAIAQRVMVNHGGFILTKGHLQKGAEFSLYFPGNLE